MKVTRYLRTRGAVVAAAVAALAITGGGVYASASSAGTAPASIAPASLTPRAVYACEGTGHVPVTFLSTPSARCAAGATSIVVGAQGPAGKPGASGVVSAGVHDLGGLSSVATGGGFVANSTEVGTVSLKAGTYLVSLAAKATPRASGDTAAIYPQFFVYGQAKNSLFTGDLMNVGAGALEPDGTNHDSYYSGSALITLASDATLHLYAFGYDSDSGAGAYVLDDLSLTAVQVTPAS